LYRVSNNINKGNTNMKEETHRGLKGETQRGFLLQVSIKDVLFKK
jgi:hypothetical protein